MTNKYASLYVSNKLSPHRNCFQNIFLKVLFKSLRNVKDVTKEILR